MANIFEEDIFKYISGWKFCTLLPFVTQQQFVYSSRNLDTHFCNVSFEYI